MGIKFKKNPEINQLESDDRARAFAFSMFEQAIDQQENYEDFDDALVNFKHSLKSEMEDFNKWPPEEVAKGLAFWDQIVANSTENGAKDLAWREPIYVPLEDLSEEEIVKLPRSAFSYPEIATLKGEVRTAIYNNDEGSRARIDKLFEVLKTQWDWHLGDQKKRYQEDSTRDSLGGNLESKTFEELSTAIDDHRLGDLVHRWEETNIPSGDIQDAIRNVLIDPDNYMFRIDDYGMQWDVGPFVVSLSNNPYFNFDMGGLPSNIYSDEVDEAIRLFTDYDGDADYLLDSGELFDMRNDAYKGINKEMDPVAAVFYKPDWDRVLESINDTLSEELDEGDEQFETGDERTEEERTFYTFRDGSYIVELRPDDLPDESEALGHCIGQSEHGYGTKLKLGFIKIYSIRTIKGRPKFTVEVAIDSEGNAQEIVQAFGKGNRYPGWNLGEISRGKVKWMEVQKVGKLAELLNLDPSDVTHLKPAHEAMAKMDKPPELTHNPARRPCCYCH